MSRALPLSFTLRRSHSLRNVVTISICPISLLKMLSSYCCQVGLSVSTGDLRDFDFDPGYGLGSSCGLSQKRHVSHMSARGSKAVALCAA